jgi:alanine or glycine:cation symporter, AGCS family
VTGKLVPIMAILYVICSVYIIGANLGSIGPAFAAIFNGAFTPEAGYGGFIGVLIQGFRRAAFSNEAGVGSAAIAHSASRTREPVSEGLVALWEPFIDTVVICTMTALVIVITGMYQAEGVGDGVQLTSMAYASVLTWFPYLLAAAVFLFAFSTMLAWSYYGEKSALALSVYLFATTTSVLRPEPDLAAAGRRRSPAHRHAQRPCAGTDIQDRRCCARHLAAATPPC